MVPSRNKGRKMKIKLVLQITTWAYKQIFKNIVTMFYLAQFLRKIVVHDVEKLPLNSVNINSFFLNRSNKSC